MRDLLNPEGPVMNFITRIVSSVWLNILWFICSVPIITAGASTTALFYVSLKLAKNEEGNITKQFFSAFRENFRFSTKVWGILLAVQIIMGIDGYVLLRMRFSNVFWTLVTAVYLVALIAFIILLMYVFPLMARFENTVLNMLKNSLMIGMRFLFCTVFMAAVYFLMILIVVRFFTPAIIFGEGLCVLICSRLISPVLDKCAGIDGDEEEGAGEEDTGEESTDMEKTGREDTVEADTVKTPDADTKAPEEPF